MILIRIQPAEISFFLFLKVSYNANWQLRYIKNQDVA